MRTAPERTGANLTLVLLGSPAQFPQDAAVRGHSTAEGLVVVVGQAMLGSDLLDDRAERRVVDAADAREEMVLDLEV